MEAAFEDFCFSFGISEARKFKLRPSDTVYGIYRKEYPKIGFMTPDAMEYEELAMSMEERDLNADFLADTTTTIRQLVCEYAGPPITMH